MKFVGHMMGTPDKTVKEAIALYHSIGMDGIEVVAQEGQAFSIDAPESLITEVMQSSMLLPDGVVTLTPYFWKINSADEKVRAENIDGVKRAVLLASRMGARFVRSYSGVEDAGGTPEENWKRAVEALREIAPVAEKNGVTVLVENHPGTMTRTGEATYQLIDAVGSSRVRALYDPANVLHDTDEPWETTYAAQKDVIAYVHCKDFFMVGGERKACPVGKGIVPWDRIMKKLAGYEGYVSFEYEKRWYPDQLPDAEIGIPQCVAYLKSLLPEEKRFF